MTDTDATFEDKEPVRGWRGDKGTIVLSASVNLEEFPDERFGVFTLPDRFIGLSFDAAVYDAIRRLQESESKLRRALIGVDEGCCMHDPFGPPCQCACKKAEEAL